MTDELVKSLRQKADGWKDRQGWPMGDWICKEAADTIEAQSKLLDQALEALENSARHDNSSGEYNATCPACGSSEGIAHDIDCAHIGSITAIKQFKEQK